MFPTNPTARATWRWGGAIAGLLIVQSLALAAMFWVLAIGSHRELAEETFVADCYTFSSLPDGERHATLRRMIAENLHRDRFLGLFDRSGRLLDGNIATVPHGVVPGQSSVVTTVVPTEVPGQTSEDARVATCVMPDGETLLTGFDLDQAREARRVVERTLAFGLAPGLLLAIGFGLIAGRRAASQIDAVRKLTSRIVLGDLDQRLPVESKPDSFGLLCAHINGMLDRLQILVSEVRDVGDDIAHQLRTPLTRLRARIERGLREAGDPAAFAAVADAALVEIDKLLGIVAALLRVRELEDNARRSRFAPVDLGQLVEDACDLYRPSAEDRGITIVCDAVEVPLVDGDASLLIEAVANLIDNAMKFGPDCGTVSVSLRPEGRGANISISDEGPGIAPGERALVTQRFYRGRQNLEGVGLGLSLVKAIVDLHGFSLRFSEKGSAISIICLPREV